MSFLFGKRKDGKDGKGDKEVKSSNSPLRADLQAAPAGSPMPPMNGVRSKERGPGVASPAPPIGVNASVGSIEGTNTPSPERDHEQRGLDHDIQVSWNCSTCTAIFTAHNHQSRMYSTQSIDRKLMADSI